MINTELEENQKWAAGYVKYTSIHDPKLDKLLPKGTWNFTEPYKNEEKIKIKRLPEVQIAIDTVVFLRDYKKSNVHYKKEIIPIVKEFFTVLNSFDVTISSDNIAFIIEYIDGIPTDDTLKAHLKTYVSQQFNSKTSGGKRRNKKRTKKHSKRRNKKRTKRCTKRRNKKRTKRPTKRRNKKRTKKNIIKFEYYRLT